MDLSFVMGFLGGFGFYVGVRTMQISNKMRGIMQLILTFLAPILVHLWCLKKASFVFGGTDWEFLVQTATVDKMIEPWLILIVYIGFMALIIYNMIQIRKVRK